MMTTDRIAAVLAFVRTRHPYGVTSHEIARACRIDVADVHALADAGTIRLLPAEDSLGVALFVLGHEVA